MDTSQQVPVIPEDRESSVAPQRQRRSIAEKRRIVEETLRRRCVGGACGAGARGQRQSGVWLASALPGRKTWETEAGDEVAAGSRERECARAFAGRAQFRRFCETTAGHDSHRTAAGAGAHRRQRRSGVGAGVAGVPASDDRVAGEHADLDRGGRDRLAARLHGAERAGRRPSWSRIRSPGTCSCFADGAAI